MVNNEDKVFSYCSYYDHLGTIYHYNNSLLLLEAQDHGKVIQHEIVKN